MSLSVGIVGLPNAGKSTLFNALLSRQIANVAPYPFCTIEPNVGVVAVPDERLDKLAQLVKLSEKLDHLPPKVPAIVEFKDIAGLVAGASKGEGLGNKFLSHIRESAAIVHVLRAFTDQNVVRTGNIDPQGDFEVVKTELCLADLQTLEKQREPNPSVATKDEQQSWATVQKIRKELEAGIEARNMNLDDEEKEIIKPLFLLTAKLALFVLNIDEKDVGLSNKELGLSESGLERLIKKGYEILGLQTFLTAGEKEVRAWTIRKGAKAPEAAGVIHTDFEKGFIKAEIVGYEDFVGLGGWKGASDAGKVRLEGKDYVMKEGDVVEFKFNV